MKFNNSLVSIIIPTYNRASLIEETIRSVQNQTYPNWECIIVDDHSTDNTNKVVSAFTSTDRRFKFLFNKRTKGAPGARNTGVEIAKGDYLIFLDSDDLLSKNCLSNRIMKFQEFSDNDFLVFSTVEFKSVINDTNILVNIPTKEDIIMRFLDLDVPWLTMAPIWRRESFLKVGRWNEDILSWQDWELHLRALFNNFTYKYFLTVDNYWRSNSNVDSIGKRSTTISHLQSHLNLLKRIKQSQLQNKLHMKKLNGLIEWIGEKGLEQGNKRVPINALIICCSKGNRLQPIINLIGVTFFKKYFFKPDAAPTFGTMRKTKFEEVIV